MLEPGSNLGSYRLIGRLGAGGMGEVWKGEDTRLGRAVAIKILPHAVSADAEAIARLKREARTAAQLYHPNIATIHAIDEAEGRLFLVMELVEGETLTRLIQRGPLSEAEACRIGRSVAAALEEAHAKGIVHRDIKPDNIIVNGDRVKVLDFGIAKFVGDAILPADPTAFVTQQGMIIGTVHYMSPEQALGKPLDARTDLFSLGVVLYEAVTGALPFQGETITETITKIVRDDAPPVRGVSPALAAIIARCLRKNRDERFASARELGYALDQVVPTAPYTRAAAPPRRAAPTVRTTAQPRRSWVTVTIVSTLLLTVALIAFFASLVRRHSLDEKQRAAASVHAAVTASDVITVSPSTTRGTVGTTETVAPAPAPRSSGEVASETVPSSVAPATPVQTVSGARSAADYYARGVAELVERQPMRARAAFLAALQADPHYANAHFRLGELALVARDVVAARSELDLAMADADRLGDRERRLTEISLALLDHDAERAEELGRQMAAVYPHDPDLQRLRELVRDERGSMPLRRRRIRPF